MSSSITVEPINNFETNAGSRRAHDVAETRTSRGQSGDRETTGRYDGQKARLLPTGLGRPAFERRDPVAHNKRVSQRPNAKLHAAPPASPTTTIAAVVDPYGNGTSRIQATININVDVLEKERCTRRISEAAYLTGRILQEKFERTNSVGGSNWMGLSKQDPMVQHELRVLAAVIHAEDITKTLERIRTRLGFIDTRLIQRVLGDNMSFAQCAEVRGRNGERGAGYIGTRFREALEDLAYAWTAKGAAQDTPNDEHLAASVNMVERQRCSIVKGVTTARRAKEAREEAKRAEMERKANPARRR